VARRLAEDSRGQVLSFRPSPARTFLVRSWLPRAAAVLVAMGAGYLAWNQWMPRDPARLIASAYTEQRPFEYRVPGAAYAPIRQERGTTSSFDRPQALNDAISKIGGELKKHPEDVKWMDLRARAEMMGRDPDAAIATLQHALEQKPDDPGLLADLGAAYALRADGQSRAVDYGYAIDYLNRAIQKKPDSPEAVFNLALVYGKMNSDDLAMSEWQQYLKLDPAGAWRQDAQRHLTELELKKKSGGRP
jgi:tetratricopeptide (TPR) repeat protein